MCVCIYIYMYVCCVCVHMNMNMNMYMNMYVLYGHLCTMFMVKTDKKEALTLFSAWPVSPDQGFTFFWARADLPPDAVKTLSKVFGESLLWTHELWASDSLGPSRASNSGCQDVGLLLGAGMCRVWGRGMLLVGCNYRLFRHSNTSGNYTMQLSMQAGILHALCAKSHVAQVPHEGSRHQLLQSSGIPQQMTGPASLSTAIVCGHANVSPMRAGCKTSRLSHESLRKMGYRLPQPRAGKCRSGVCGNSCKMYLYRAIVHAAITGCQCQGFCLLGYYY